jgi:3',5'-cyclic AMP phosphodiesterase CpdA
MRIRVLSDLHLEFADWTPPKGDEDVVVLAGDIQCGVHGITWARKHFRLTPVIYVPGNHEYYGEDLIEHLEALRHEGRKRGVDVLDGNELVLDGVRFLGATLWTDYALHGDDSAVIQRELDIAREAIEDFQVIRKGNRPFRPKDALALHRERVGWLQEALPAAFSGPTVVVSHHAPHPRSIHRQFRFSALNPSFASDLSRLMGLPRAVAGTGPVAVTPAVWIHGHMHTSTDYVECDTRVVCNPRGYLPYEPNPDFNPTLTIEVTA